MKKLIAGFFVILISRVLSAQEPVILPVPLKDSVYQEKLLFYEPGLDLPESEAVVPGIVDIKTNMELPALDFSRYLNSRWTVDYASFSGSYLNTGNYRTLLFRPLFSPFGGEGTILNQATYRVSDKLRIGGNSFGVNSILHGPPPRFGSNSFDFRGASLFMEYKVSKNFRIGGGITVTGHPLQP